MVVPREAFEAVGAFNGVRMNAQEYLSAFFGNGVAHYMDRDEAEQNPQFKQIIAYAIFCCNGKVLAYARTSKGGEARLHDKWSLGIGGHINPVDGLADNIDTYLAGVEREIREEISFSGTATQKLYAVINDDTNEVGSVHLGFFFTMEVEDASVRETDKLEGLWLKRSELSENMENMETWSQIACEALV